MSTEAYRRQMDQELVVEAREYVEIYDVLQRNPGISALDILSRLADALEGRL